LDARQHPRSARRPLRSDPRPLGIVVLARAQAPYVSTTSRWPTSSARSSVVSWPCCEPERGFTARGVHDAVGERHREGRGAGREQRAELRRDPRSGPGRQFAPRSSKERRSTFAAVDLEEPGRVVREHAGGAGKRCDAHLAVALFLVAQALQECGAIRSSGARPPCRAAAPPHRAEGPRPPPLQSSGRGVRVTLPHGVDESPATSRPVMDRW